MKGLIFTYVLTYGGAVASLVRPFTGLLIYVCFSIVKPEGMWYWAVPAGSYSRIVAIALLVGWTLGGFGSWRFGRATAVVYCFVAFWTWGLLSSLQAHDPTRGFIWCESLGKVVLPFVVGMTLLTSVERLKMLAWVIVLSQGYVAFELNMAYLGGFNRLLEVGFADMDNNCVAIAMVTGVGSAFFLGLHSPRLWQKGLAFASAGLMVHTILFSFSRGGMLALVITAAVAFLITPKKPVYYLVLIVAVLIGLRLAGPQVRNRFMTGLANPEDRDTSAVSRLELWEDCWDSMLKRPLFGVGPHNFPLIAREYGWQEGKEAHSLWMQGGAELGFPGLGLILLFYLICMFRLIPYTLESKPVNDPWIRAFARMIVASTVGFIVAAQFVSLMGLELPYYVNMIGAGALRLASTPVRPVVQPAILAHLRWQAAFGGPALVPARRF